MKKNLMPLQMLVEETLIQYKDNETPMKKEDLMEMLEEALWLAPDLYVKHTGAYSLKGTFSVRYKNSDRRINGGCEIVTENIRIGTSTKYITVNGSQVPVPMVPKVAVVIREIKFNHEIL